MKFVDVANNFQPNKLCLTLFAYSCSLPANISPTILPYHIQSISHFFPILNFVYTSFSLSHFASVTEKCDFCIVSNIYVKDRVSSIIIPPSPPKYKKVGEAILPQAFSQTLCPRWGVRSTQQNSSGFIRSEQSFVSS